MKIALLLAGLWLMQTGWAQQVTQVNGTLKHTVNLKNIEHKDQVFIDIQHLESPSPDGTSMKAELQRRKQALQEKYPRKTTFPLKNAEAKSGPNPIIQNGYTGNPFGSGSPCDNTLAINNSGIVMTARNSSYMIYDANTQTVLKTGSLKDFLPPIISNDFDPKLIYDPTIDRFVIIFLLGTTPNRSRIAICFAETSDPLGNWNTYFLKGDALNTNHWSDYPAISLTEDEIFITINLLNPGGSWQTSFHQTIVWQIDKQTGYDGNTTLDSQIWDNIQEGGGYLRNMHPVRNGLFPSGPNQYFISNRNFATQSDSIYLIEVTNTMASGSATMNISLIHANNDYFLAPNGQQSTSDELATNDSRVLGAILENDKIHFVQNCRDTASGNAAIYHGIIEGISAGNYSCSGTVLSDSVKDFGYPNIAHIGEFASLDQYLISFEYSSPVDSAGTACFFYNDTAYSELNIIRQGEGVLNASSGNLERWGDYTGIQKKYNEPCAVWSVGTFATDQNQYGVWVSEIRSSGNACASSVGIDEVQTMSFELYPNPTVEYTTIQFELNQSQVVTVELFDITGRPVRVLYQDKAKKGKNRLRLGTNILARGQYILSIRGEDGQIAAKKIVKQ